MEIFERNIDMPQNVHITVIVCWLYLYKCTTHMFYKIHIITRYSPQSSEVNKKYLNLIFNQIVEGSNFFFYISLQKFISSSPLNMRATSSAVSPLLFLKDGSASCCSKTFIMSVLLVCAAALNNVQP